MAASHLFLKTITVTLQPGIRPLVRFTVAMRMHVYGDCADRNIKVPQVLELVTSQALKDFCGLAIEKFDSYLNKCPLESTKEKILCLMAKGGFP